MNKNQNLHQAKADKNDEFYTQLKDIENELRHYEPHFKDKVVYCNCDDPQVSNFFKYFSVNFERLGLKKLLTSCYRNKDAGKRIEGVSDKAFWLEMQTAGNSSVYEFEGDGDFRSEEALKLLREADIVVTNPPFSLFREYVAQLVAHDKQFLVVGNVNAITYKEIFPLIKNNQMWLGDNTARHFLQPDGTLYETARTFWYTNLDFAKRHEDLVLSKEYSEEAYPKYDNYDAINVNRATDIPMDYNGLMGVPITFLGKCNPDQFEILGNLGSYAPDGYSLCGAIYVDGKKIFKRIVIRRKRTETECPRCFS